MTWHIPPLLWYPESSVEAYLQDASTEDFTVTGCCPDWTVRARASCDAARWRKTVWSGRGRRWRMSRCPPLQIQRWRRRGGELGEPSSSPESLLPGLLSSSQLPPPSPPLPLIQPLPPPLAVETPSASRHLLEWGCQEVAVETLGRSPSSQQKQQPLPWLRLSCWSWSWTTGRPRTPEPRPSSRCRRARSHRASGGHRGSGRGPAGEVARCCPASLDSGKSSGSLYRNMGGWSQLQADR